MNTSKKTTCFGSLSIKKLSSIAMSAALIFPAFVGAQQPKVDLRMVSEATVTDQKIIETIVLTSLIPEDPAKVDSVKFIDATNNGFGDNDLVIFYPSQAGYLFFADDRVKVMMKNWTFSEGRQIVAQNPGAGFFENGAPEDSVKAAVADLLAGTIRNVDSTFQGIPVKLLFQRYSDGLIRFNVWGYDEKGQAPAWLKPQFARVDTHYILKTDTVFIPAADSVKIGEQD